MSTLAQDFRYGLKMLARTPVVSAVAALSLTLAIAANAAMFALLDGFLFSPLPFADQHELVGFREIRPGESTDMAAGVSIPDFREYVAASTSLEGATAYRTETVNLTGREVPEQLLVVTATPSLLDVLGVPPMIGRGFRPEEGVEGRGRVVVLEHDFWERAFLADPGALGEVVTLDGVPHEVIGVLPEGFDMIPANIQAIRPSDFDDQSDARANLGYLAFGRLRPGVSVEQAMEELAPVSARILETYPEEKRGRRLELLSVERMFPGDTDRQLVKILTFVTLFGLLIACANVANLLLGRAEARQKEIAVRTALGAGRGRILRQLLTESVTLGAVAGGAGVALSIVLVDWLRRQMPPQMPASMLPDLSPSVVVTTMLVAVAAGVVFGLAPALHAARGDLREALGEGSRGGTASRTRRRIRNAFVMGEFAVALGLLTGAGYLLQAFERLADQEPGYESAGLLTFSVVPLEERYPAADDRRAYYRELIAVLADVPGVEGVAVMNTLPRGQERVSTTTYEIPGRPRPDDEEPPRADFQSVNPDYFRTLGIELRSGRLFDVTDDADAQPVAVVSDQFARDELEGDALGRTVVVRDEERVVVGVVEDVLHRRMAVVGFSEGAIYVPVAQMAPGRLDFAVRAAGEPEALAGPVRRAVWAVEPDQPLGSVRTLDAHTAESLAGPRAISVFLSVLAGIAVVLAALGIYGVMAHAVAQRRREIGIRMALGAGRGSVLGMVTRSGLTLAGAGLLLGTPLAVLMYSGVRRALNVFDVSMGIGWPLAIAGALVASAVLATWLPAVRASGISPSLALRDD